MGPEDKAHFESEAADALSFMTRHYDCGRFWLLDPSKKEDILGNSSVETRCRFCGKAFPEVRFCKNAHAISELLGNKTLFVHYECDRCNQYFGNTLENDLGNWSKPLRSMCHIYGKRGVPTIKSRDGKARFSVADGVMHVTHGPEDTHFVVDEANNMVTMTLPRDGYRPLRVLKAFVKSALNIIPEERIALFGETIRWICDAGGDKPLIANHKIGVEYVPGPTTQKTMVASLFFRTNDYDFVPYCLFVLTFGNTSVQLVIPSPRKDWHLGGVNIKIPFFPRQTWEDRVLYGEPIRFADDMSDPNVVSNSALKIDFKYSERQRRED